MPTQNVVIRQNGLRPGQPGASITVPLATLQSLQAGQGIPTGQPGHLLVRTETGQYQILRVGPTANTQNSSGGSGGSVSAPPPPSVVQQQPPPTVVRSVNSVVATPGGGPGSPLVVRQNGPLVAAGGGGVNAVAGTGPQIIRPVSNAVSGGGLMAASVSSGSMVSTAGGGSSIVRSSGVSSAPTPQPASQTSRSLF